MSNSFQSPPINPPPPLFVGKKERDFAKQVTIEIAERINGQGIFYYPIDIERSNFHPLYGECLNKVFFPPIAIYAFVEWEGMKTESGTHGLDKTASITVKFHKRRLEEDQDLYVREGDFVRYGDFFFEISSLEEPSSFAGQIDSRYEIVAKCKRSRQNVFSGE